MVETIRKILDSWKSVPTVEGAGVRLRRAFGSGEVPRLDPFLLLDDFRSKDPKDYLAGFPWHPHRGIETITYVLSGTVEHGDSMKNAGIIGAGDAQWMTAGSGIVHQEMPKPGAGGRMGGFQLWANLPSAGKMMRPRYRDVPAASIPRVSAAGGATVGVLCGAVGGVQGPVRDIVTDPEYLDVALPAGASFRHPAKKGYTVFAYVFGGGARFDPEGGPETGEGTLLLFGNGTSVFAEAGEAGARFLLVSGKPLGEPVAWGGPIVMNTREELRIAFEEYREGTFLKG